MADKYLVLQAGDTAINYNGGSRWFDADLTTPVTDPTSSDNVIMGASAFPSAGQSLVVNSTAYCLSMDWTGATNSPTLAGSSQIRFYGNVIFIADMLFTNTGGILGYGTAGTQTITTNGMSFPACFLGMAGGTGGTLQFQDNINGIPSLYLAGGTLDTNDVTVNCGRILDSGSAVKVFDFGTSTINVSSVTGVSITGTNTSFSANTATINVSSTGAVALGNANWNGASFNLTGTAHTVSGSPTGIDEFNFVPTGGTQTATISAGADISAVTMTETGTVTIQSSVAGELYTLRGSTSAAITGATMSDYILADGDEVTVDCSGATGGTFAGADGTYTSMTVAGAGNYALTITGDNTFNNLTIDRSEESKELVLTGTTQTVTNFLCPVSSTNTLTITGGTITKAGGGQIALDYLVLDTSIVTPASTWYAGEHSYISGGTVSGWIFGDPSGGGTRSLMPAIII